MRAAAVGLQLAIGVLAVAMVKCTFDVRIVPGTHRVKPYTVTIKTNDWQDYCLSLTSATSDVYLECELQGPFAEEYIKHCIYSLSDHKAKKCCDFCCAPLNEVESLHYARTGEKRCNENDKYCLERLDEECPVQERYQHEQTSLKNYVVSNHQNVLNARGIVYDDLAQSDSWHVSRGTLATQWYVKEGGQSV